MSTTTAARPFDARLFLEDDDEPIKFGETIALHDVDWEGYETLLKLVGDRHIRVTYLEGYVELMSPSLRHENPSERLADIVSTLIRLLRLPCKKSGLLTFKDKALKKGFEGDRSYYITNLERIRGKTEIDPAIDPPPDLVVEVEITSRLREKLELYEKIGVPELWCFNGRKFRLLRLDSNGKYVESETSVAFPALRAEEIEDWMTRSDPYDDTAWQAEVENWIQTVVLPRYQHQQ